MKIALCFIINYEHKLNKEHIWREWIQPNADIINTYFFYKDLNKIKSQWIIDNAIPANFICNTSYYHVVPAYISLFNYSISHDKHNQWFCMLTDSCCPIISPSQFRRLFFDNYKASIFSWKPAWWNPYFHKRGNLASLPTNLWLGNDAWFILSREKIEIILKFIREQRIITTTICNGGLANESLFAIIFKLTNVLHTTIICEPSHIIDWNRMASSTSPHLFYEANEEDIQFIDKELERNKYAVFIRKISADFPDNIIRKYIDEKNIDEKNIGEKNIDEKGIDNKYLTFVTLIALYKLIIIIILLTCFPSIATNHALTENCAWFI